MSTTIRLIRRATLSASSAAALAEILRLARRGLRVCLRHRPSEPGARKSASFERDLEALSSLPNVGKDLGHACPAPALVEGNEPPEFWAREDGDEMVFFFAHPKSRELSYPMAHGQSLCRESVVRKVVLRPFGREVDLELRFEPYRSLLVTVGRHGEPTLDDLGYVPPEPSTAGAEG